MNKRQNCCSLQIMLVNQSETLLERNKNKSSNQKKLTLEFDDGICTACRNIERSKS